jgi:acetylornithine deacetylase/succinyl-diaminopimelate desuccinylase-like protein
MESPFAHLEEHSMTDRSAWTHYLETNEQQMTEELLQFLRIPSISTSPEHADAVREAASWLAGRLRSAGMPEVELIKTPRYPVVFGQWHVDPVKATLLLYGHYDVQPPEPLELWEAPPFEPSIRDGLIYARGAADMKANLLSMVQAIESFHKTTGAPPVNMTILFEGEEEIGSPHLPEVVRARRDQLAPDAILSGDGGMHGPDSPSLTVAFKGLAGCQIDLRTGSTDLHSGSYGAAVPNAIRSLVTLAASFHNPDGSVAVDGFYDDVAPLTERDRTEMARIDANEKEFLEESGAIGLAGEAGYSLIERRWARPTLDMNGIWGGFQGEGAKTVTPCEAHLKITCRLVANQDPGRIIDRIQNYVQKHSPAGASVTVTPLPGKALPFSLDRDNRALKIASTVLQSIYGKEPLLVRSGGTVPITEVFTRELGVGTVTIGFGMRGSRAHAPNEWFRLEDLPTARRTYAAFLEALATTR